MMLLKVRKYLLATYFFASILFCLAVKNSLTYTGCKHLRPYGMYSCKGINVTQQVHYNQMKECDRLKNSPSNTTILVNKFYFESCSRLVIVNYIKSISTRKHLEIRRMPPEIDFVNDILYDQSPVLNIYAHQITFWGEVGYFTSIIIQQGTIEEIKDLENVNTLQHIEMLVLNNVQLKKVDMTAFVRLQKLKILILENNCLTVFRLILPDSVEYVSVKGNRILQINKILIPKNIHYLDLSANPLSKLSFERGTYYPRLLRLDGIKCKTIKTIPIQQILRFKDAGCKTLIWRNFRCDQTIAKVQTTNGSIIPLVISERPRVVYLSRGTQWWYNTEDSIACHDPEYILDDALFEGESTDALNAMERLAGVRLVYHINHMIKYANNGLTKTPIIRMIKMKVKFLKHVLKDQIVIQESVNNPMPIDGSELYYKKTIHRFFEPENDTLIL